jgi:CHAD domain-containing protein
MIIYATGSMNEFLDVQEGERAPQRLRRKALDLADDAFARLDAMSSGDPKALHDVRRRLKELRAMASLLGQSDVSFFGDAGRVLSPYRDAKAAVEAFDRLRERFATDWTPRQFQKIRRTLVQRCAETVDEQIVKDLRAALTVERGQIAAWPVDEMKRDDLWRAITKSYRRARRAMRTAREELTAETLHEWRKRVKIHWYHAQFFTDVNIARLDTESLRKLSRRLGDHHDLVIVNALSEAAPQNFRQYVATRLRELEVDALTMGRELFATRARNWEVRVRLTASPADVRVRMRPAKSPEHFSSY